MIVKVPVKFLEVPAKILNVPAKKLEVPAKTLEVPSKIHKVPAKIFEDPLERSCRSCGTDPRRIKYKNILTRINFTVNQTHFF